jgi:hypothetical protein
MAKNLAQLQWSQRVTRLRSGFGSVGYQIQFAAASQQLSIETRWARGVANIAIAAALNLQQESILVTIYTDLDHRLDLARGLTLLPQSLA